MHIFCERLCEGCFHNAMLQEVVGTDATSMEELMERVNRAVSSGTVESVTMTVGTQRRAGACSNIHLATCKNLA